MTLVIEFIVAALLVGVLSVLVVMLLLHSRASQSTKRRLEATAPPSATEITAGGDVLQPTSVLQPGFETLGWAYSGGQL